MSYATTFARIPDDIILAVSSRELDLNCADTCLCGWALREAIGQATQRDAEDVSHREWNERGNMTADECAAHFGGTWLEWQRVFGGVTQADKLPEIETAWVNRLDKAVERAR